MARSAWDPVEVSSEREEGEADDAEQHGGQPAPDREGGQERRRWRGIRCRAWTLGRPVGQPPASSTPSVAMTWTSSAPPAARMTELMTEPRTYSARRLRWVAPRTSWVAFSARATCTSAGATSAPTTST